MKAVGLLCGAGSLLREAQDVGFDVVGNVDPRPYFRNAPWLWDLNFPDAPYHPDVESVTTKLIDEWRDADLALGHPPCGSHSLLGQSISKDLSVDERARRHARRAEKVGLLPLFTQLVRLYRPKLFAMDNLLKILRTVAPREWWMRELGRLYHLDFITIINRDYGSPQRRIRLWVLGTRRDLRPFRFTPITTPRRRTVLDALTGLPWEPWRDVTELGHVHLRPEDKPLGSFWSDEQPRRQLRTVAEVALGFLQIPPQHAWVYRTQTGRMTRKVGVMRIPTVMSRVVSGMPSLFHPLTGWPLTPRERARLMGWPDDFHLTDEAHPVNRSMTYRLARITGKAVPSEFPRYLLPLMFKHLRRS